MTISNLTLEQFMVEWDDCKDIKHYELILTNLNESKIITETNSSNHFHTLKTSLQFCNRYSLKVKANFNNGSISIGYTEFNSGLSFSKFLQSIFQILFENGIFCHFFRIG